jgi:hypothetical protein
MNAGDVLDAALAFLAMATGPAADDLGHVFTRGEINRGLRSQG